MLSIGYLVTGQGCLRALTRDDEPNDPPFNDDNNNPLPASNAVQAIITTYKFYCDCVNITTWETYIQSGQEIYSESMSYDITFQVWRPSPTVQDTGCYSLVGENVFTRLNFQEGSFVQLSPPRNEIITAKSGDVVGYYTNNQHRPDNGIQLERNYDYSNNIIWYQSFRNGNLVQLNNECPFPVGTESDRVLRSSTGAAPMLKISTSKFFANLHRVPCKSNLLCLQVCFFNHS